MDEYIATPKQWRVFHGKIEYICRKPIKSTLYTVGMMTDSRKKRRNLLMFFVVSLSVSTLFLSLCPSYTYIHVYYVISLNLYLLNS